MEFPQLQSLEQKAVDIVVSVVNRAKEKLGVRQTLQELADTRETITSKTVLHLTSLKIPVAITAEAFIADTIEKKWRLTDTFKFVLYYKNCSRDETSQYYYYEAVFSQPSAAYPIPQATASVYFRVEDKYIDRGRDRPVPSVVFRLEGHNSEHDARHMFLVPDRLLSIIKMKIKLFQRIENMMLF